MQPMLPIEAGPITQQQLESYVWGAATLLRGVIDAGDYKQFIFPLLFLKRISDVYDEEFARALEESGGEEDERNPLRRILIMRDQQELGEQPHHAEGQHHENDGADRR